MPSVETEYQYTSLSGSELIMLERARQLSQKGFSIKDDLEENSKGQLAMAALCYVLPPEARLEGFLNDLWPWRKTLYKPKCFGKTDNETNLMERMQELVRAGSLLCAEIDRLQYLYKMKETSESETSESEISESELGGIGK